MSIKDLDYQAKVIAPTQQLYIQLSEQASVLFTQVKESAIDFHAKVSEMGLEIYEQPVETATRWQTEAVEKSNQLYVIVNDNILPAIKDDYDKIMISITDYGLQSYQSFQMFLDNPEKITVEAFTEFNQSLSTYLDKALDVSSIILNNLTNKADEIINLLIEQPIEAMKDFYYQSLTNLLNSYFDIISSVLVSI